MIARASDFWLSDPHETEDTIHDGLRPEAPGRVEELLRASRCGLGLPAVGLDRGGDVRSEELDARGSGGE